MGKSLFAEDDVINGKFVVVSKLGSGWEGEVFLVRERDTGVERAAKCFYAKRNKKSVAAKRYARKLHKLRRCEILAQYHAQEPVFIDGRQIDMVLSEFIEGDILSEYLKKQPGKRLHPYMALHVLYAMAKGLECIHDKGEYHGDLHMENFIVERVGVKFDLKLLDIYHWGVSKRVNIQDDVVDLIHIFFEMIGGQKAYASSPAWVKELVCGRKKGLILKKYNTAGKLRKYLENLKIE